MTPQDLLQQLTNQKYAIDQSSIVAATDISGVITYANEMFCEVSGYSHKELIGKTHSLLNSNYHPNSFFKEMWNTIRTGEVWKGDIRNRRKDGTYYWVNTTIVPFRNNEGQIYQYLSIRHDITDLKMAQQLILEQQARLAVASKFSALGEMAANLTHEINNPLAAILGRCELLIQQLQKPNMNPTTLLSGVEAIEFTARRIEKIVKSMRSFSVAGDRDPFELVSVKFLAEEAADFVQQRFKYHGIELKVLPIDEDLQLECRGTEISQVLLNLINNAFDAVQTYEEKWVQVEASKNGAEYIQITVTDSGKGISQNILDRIFDPFFSTKEKQYGTGLGLSISKGLIERHKGTLDIDHSCKNTRFIITLPIKQS